MDNKEIIYELINGISSSKKVQLRDDTNLLDTQILDSLGIAQLVAGLEANFNIEFDEGAGYPDDDERNAYGPYYQTQRVDIYHVYAKIDKKILVL